jgi:protein TonB
MLGMAKVWLTLAEEHQYSETALTSDTPPVKEPPPPPNEPQKPPPINEPPKPPPIKEPPPV